MVSHSHLIILFAVCELVCFCVSVLSSEPPSTRPPFNVCAPRSRSRAVSTRRLHRPPPHHWAHSPRCSTSVSRCCRHCNSQVSSSSRPQLELSDDGTCLLAPVETSDDRGQRLQVQMSQTHKRIAGSTRQLGRHCHMSEQQLHDEQKCACALEPAARNGGRVPSGLLDP